jgi:hypothetical protein
MEAIEAKIDDDFMRRSKKYIGRLAPSPSGLLHGNHPSTLPDSSHMMP